jgi:hypothetical protein
LEEIPGIGPKMVEKIQDAVVSYYGQFEDQMDAPQPAEAGAAAPVENAGETIGEPAAALQTEASSELAASNHQKTLEEEPAHPIESDTIKDAE